MVPHHGGHSYIVIVFPFHLGDQHADKFYQRILLFCFDCDVSPVDSSHQKEEIAVSKLNKLHCKHKFFSLSQNLGNDYVEN